MRQDPLDMGQARVASNNALRERAPTVARIAQTLTVVWSAKHVYRF